MACLMLVNNKTWACADMGDEHLAEVFSIYSNDYTYSNYERLMKYWAAYTGDKTPFRPNGKNVMHHGIIILTKIVPD